MMKMMTHHSTSTDCSSRDMEPVPNKYSTVLVPPCRHKARGSMPLPPPITMPGETIGISHWRAPCIPPTTEEEQPVTSSSSSGVHSRGGHLASVGDLAPLVWFLRGVEGPGVT